MNERKMKQKMVIYQAKSGAIELHGDFSSETIWANQKQIAEVFNCERSVITKHINKIFKDKEVDEKSNVQKMHIANSDKPVKFYNLDIMLAVGYRANSARAIEFRKWATKTLKQHIIKGYTINKKLIKKNYDEFMDAVENVQRLLPKENVIPVENILELIKAFAETWISLESYDEDVFPKAGATKKIVEVQANELYGVVEKLKKQLIKKKQATDLFAQEKRSKNLEGILGNVLQKAFGKELYPTVEQKAAHLLYFVVKNHPFNDGNKRAGAFSFIWFLQKSGIKFRHKITPEALTAITLLIAQSNPKDKDRMVGLVLMLLKK